MPEPRSDHRPSDAPDLERLRRENKQLREDLRRSEAERQRLRRENEKLNEELDAARRTVSRQAAPFSRGTPVAQPRVPGRKAGPAYGPKGHRRVPLHVDETYEAPLLAVGSWQLVVGSW